MLCWPLCLYGNAQEAEAGRPSMIADCRGKLDALAKMNTVKVILTDFQYGEIPLSAEQLRNGKTGVDRESLGGAILDSVLAAVQETGYAITEKSDSDWTLDIAYLNYFQKSNEKVDEKGNTTFSLQRIKKLELTFSDKSKAVLCHCQLTPKEDVSMTMQGDGRGGMITKYNVESVPKEIKQLVLDSIPSKSR